MKNILAVPYMNAVKQYALKRGLPFWTWNQQMISIRLFNQYIKDKCQ